MTILSNIIAPTNILSETNTATVSNKIISGSNNTLSNLDASTLTTGTVPFARLPTLNEWTYAGQFTGSYYTFSDDMFDCITNGISSYLSAYNSVKVVIDIDKTSASDYAILPRLSFLNNTTSVSAKAFLEQGVPTTSAGYYVYRRTYNSSLLILSNYTPYNRVSAEIYFLGRTDRTFSASTPKEQTGYSRLIGNQFNSNYGPIACLATFQPLNTAFDDIKLTRSSSALVNIVIEVYVK